MKKRLTPAALAVLLGLLAGCSSHSEPSDPTPSITGEPVATSSALPPESVDSHHPHDEPVDVPEATWNTTEQSEVEQIALTVSDLYTQTGRNQKEWWGDLSTYLTPMALQDYAYVETVNLTDYTLTGVTATRSEIPLLAQVDVGTLEAAHFTIWLSRVNSQEPWLVDRIIPPSSQNREW